MSRALVTLAEQGVEAEAAARARLTAVFERFIAAAGTQKNETGKELIQAIFGRDALPKIRFANLPDSRVGDWYKNFGSFILCGTRQYPKTVLKQGMKPFGSPF